MIFSSLSLMAGKIPKAKHLTKYQNPQYRARTQDIQWIQLLLELQSQMSWTHLTSTLARLNSSGSIPSDVINKIHCFLCSVNLIKKTLPLLRAAFLFGFPPWGWATGPGENGPANSGGRKKCIHTYDSKKSLHIGKLKIVSHYLYKGPFFWGGPYSSGSIYIKNTAVSAVGLRLHFNPLPCGTFFYVSGCSFFLRCPYAALLSSASQAEAWGMLAKKYWRVSNPVLSMTRV